MTKKDNARIEQLEKQVAELLKIEDNDMSYFTQETKPKFDIGTWYKHKVHKALVCCESHTDDHVRGYGFDSSEFWRDHVSYSEKQLVEASNKEIETALIKEAIYRGFKEGVRFKSPFSNDVFTFTHFGKWEKRMPNWSLVSEGHGAIFANGKWAEIIEDTLTIHGETLKIEGDIVSFGCAKFETHQIMEYLAIFSTWTESNRKINSIILDSGKQLTIQDLESIVEFINKKAE